MDDLPKLEDRLELDSSQVKQAGPLTARVGLVNTATGALLPAPSKNGPTDVGAWRVPVIYEP